ncbi:hypothetical protein GKG47_08230 [Lactonifactor sp. BIOML-A3]|nr:hypothetical protein [Lactonifactor sp. BIOML-A5]MSA07815.1 hypothetical protein [Lactonifactor sp. BIOML-A4]MSA12432.1 hypothetical protein [Lactonifactor sp. BIOML-A3]MSA17519.1 hypothetical protein [Lactonifactor sp. BIOML-A2]MSA38006.1 hypothetical protein [Lactonifactor sp. BIOML-A1]MSB13262.1 hypothetical protein [Lactonifactor sp. BIOML-A6]MSB68750.1 hypothetical protein [Lactonifactor sp. BIOML-A7]
MFEFMKILTLHVSYECLRGGILPAYLGSTIRGIIGNCIHEFYCHHRNVKCFLCDEYHTPKATPIMDGSRKCSKLLIEKMGSYGNDHSGNSISYT